MTSFIDKLTTAIAQHNSLLCVGLDPDIERIPRAYMSGKSDIERIKGFCLDIIEKTTRFCCCYKPNSAFFEQFGGQGLHVLKEIIARIPPEIPVLLDAKRGDIGNTAKAYARAAFEELNVDAITVNPYLGEDSVAPFLTHEGKMVFLLCHTSNPSAPVIQHHGTYPLYLHVAEVGQTWGSRKQIGYVVGATQPQALHEVRRCAPDRWILAPGVGAQGGSIDDALSAGLDSSGSGLIIPVSRSVLYASEPARAAENMRALINARRIHSQLTEDLQRKALVLELFQAGCVKFGDFLLASGKRSPIYVDLRRVISYPSLFGRVIDLFEKTLAELTFDRLAAVPYAALPLTGALSMRMQVPMIYPRKEVKDHGTAQSIEGDFKAGQIVVLIEDVITSGSSVLQAVETLEAAQVRVNEIVVLVDRQQGGQDLLQSSGYHVHSILTLGYILDTLSNTGHIDRTTYSSVLATLT